MPGMIWQRGTSMWSEDFAKESIFPRSNVARALDLHGSFGVPIKNGDEFIGVMEFFTARVKKPDEDLLRSMTTVGIQVAQYMQRKKYEEDVRHKRK